jgi:pilus assembly protein FimV
MTGKTLMQKLFRLCLWQVVLGILTFSVFFIGTLSTSGYAFSQEVQAQERGIRMRGPKSTDVFPYDRYGPITKRDTLWKIALTVRPDSRLSVYQVMEALYEANPNSFVDSNFNHLIEGRYLKIPSFDRMMSVNTEVAKQKSRQDDKDWQKKQPKKVAKKAIAPKEPSVNKKDLDTVKVEINDQLQKIDHEQQQRLTNIQNDVLDSIDGLQAILKENEDLRQRLTSFNSQLGNMQKEVAKGKEIKLQMDDMIKLQQALLEKAQAREQELLLEKQQAELEKDNIFSKLWFIVLMATLPAILVLLVVALIFKRRKTETISESKPKKKSKSKSEIIPEDPKADINEIDELSLDDELSLEDELSLDDDLSIDLLDEEGKDEEDVIHLDEDDDDALEGLDDLEDILLDDDSDVLEGSELEQGALDSLLMEDDAIEKTEAKENEALVNDQLEQSDLDDLLNDLGNDDLVVEDEGLSNIEEVDIDDVLLASMAIDEEPSAEANVQADITDPDDIDALLESMNVDAASSAEDDVQVDITDPDDIDALLESMDVDEVPSAEANVQTEITDPDDIDALLESMDVDEEPSAEVNVQAEITDPDDIDALLESIDVDAASSAEANVQTEITDPDDIDALLESMDVDEEPSAEANVQAEITDPDDIDALLESMNVDEEPSAEANVQADITDPDDIDALLESMDVDEESSAEANVQAESTDPDDIDTLLASMDGESLGSDYSEEKVVDKKIDEQQGSQNKVKIENLTEKYVAPLLAVNFSDILAKQLDVDPVAVESSKENLADDDFDLDSLLADVENNTPEQDTTTETEFDIGDDLAEGAFDEETLAELLNEQATETAIELTPDFSDQNVLADLLNDDSNDSSKASEATEINDIQELDSLDFDELLANIEEESSVVNKSVDFNDSLDVVDDVSLSDFDNISPNIPPNDNKQAAVNEQNFVSVDSLLSENQNEISQSEPYNKANIDVGLNEFPEFTDGVNQIDVDIDENGMAAKLDLAKVYIEIGDQDNAHAILQEVVKRGDTQQQVVAQELLDNL